MNKNKPHHGVISDAKKVRVPLGWLTDYPGSLGYYIEGIFENHPTIRHLGHTSLIMREVPDYGTDGPSEVETMNSRYTIYWRGSKVQSPLQKAIAKAIEDAKRIDVV